MSARPDLPGGAPGAPHERALTREVDRWRAAVNALLELSRFTLCTQAIALFAIEEERLRLVGSHGLTQQGLDVVSDAWTRGRAAVAAGAPRWIEAPPGLLLPCSDSEGPAGLAYLEGQAAHAPSVWPPLLSLGHVLARALRGAPADADSQALDSTPAARAAAALYMLMEHHEWNVARATRALGVSRMTVYNRLRRAGIKRQHVVKTPPSKHRASRVAPPEGAGPGAG